MNISISIKEFARQEKAKITANLKNPDFQLSDLVEASGMSRSRYIATFKKAFGKTPIAMVNELRLKKAAHMILSTHYKIKRISQEVGFADRHYFCRCFRSFYGMTTTEYREQNKKE